MDLPATAKDAERLGVPFFYTGIPCANGHVDKRRWIRSTLNGKSYLCSKCETCRKEHRGKTRKNDVATQYRNKVNAVIRSRLNGSRHRCTTVSDIIGCSIEAFMSHIEKQWQPGMSWDNWGAWHIDHIKPCRDFDLTDEKQRLECFNYLNTRPLWAKDNRNPGKSK